jgi:hypothetical protein
MLFLFYYLTLSIYFLIFYLGKRTTVIQKILCTFNTLYGLYKLEIKAVTEDFRLKTRVFVEKQGVLSGFKPCLWPYKVLNVQSIFWNTVYSFLDHTYPFAKTIFS